MNGKYNFLKIDNIYFYQKYTHLARFGALISTSIRSLWTKISNWDNCIKFECSRSIYFGYNKTTGKRSLNKKKRLESSNFLFFNASRERTKYSTDFVFARSFSLVLNNCKYFLYIFSRNITIAIDKCNNTTLIHTE